MNDGIRQDALIPAHLMAALFLTFLALFAGVSLTAAPISVTVSPRVSLAPSTWTVQVHVPRDAQNRAVRVETDGPNFARASAWDLEGDQAATVFTLRWFGIGEGDYEVRATVYTATGPRGSDRVAVTVR